MSYFYGEIRMATRKNMRESAAITHEKAEKSAYIRSIEENVTDVTVRKSRRVVRQAGSASSNVSMHVEEKVVPVIATTGSLSSRSTGRHRAVSQDPISQDLIEYDSIKRDSLDRASIHNSLDHRMGHQSVGRESTGTSLFQIPTFDALSRNTSQRLSRKKTTQSAKSGQSQKGRKTKNKWNYLEDYSSDYEDEFYDDEPSEISNELSEDILEEKYPEDEYNEYDSEYSFKDLPSSYSNEDPFEEEDDLEKKVSRRRRSRRRLNAQERAAADEVALIELDLRADRAASEDRWREVDEDEEIDEEREYGKRRRGNRRGNAEKKSARKEATEGLNQHSQTEMDDEVVVRRRRRRAVIDNSVLDEEDDIERAARTSRTKGNRTKSSKKDSSDLDEVLSSLEDATSEERKQAYINQIKTVEGSTRLVAKKQRRFDSRRDHTHSTLVIEEDLSAVRENVDRQMIIREKGRHTQISVLEDNILVEHYVSDIDEISTVGNIYIGRIQNVLPGMEAAFVNIGEARNGVLYSSEVNWDTTRLEGQAGRIELAYRSSDPLLVQVTKDPIGHKGARLTSQITLAGRYLVLVPSGNMTGISRRLSEKERTRLKAIVNSVSQKDEGIIIRTAAEGVSEEAIIADYKYLSKLWKDIHKKYEKYKDAQKPRELYREPDVAIRVIRDSFNDSFSKLIIEGEKAQKRIRKYIKNTSPELLDKLCDWDPAEHQGQDAFDQWNIDSQLRKGMERQVYLPSGGSLVIDRTEAMTTIDVNTGRFIGKGGSLEETVTHCNLEAAEEIVRQLRLRDIGGMIMIDFVDMVLDENRELVLRRLIECLGRDRTKHQVAEVTSLGLVQMTRKRVGQGLVEAFSEECPTCHGRGFILHDEPTVDSKAKDPYEVKGGDPFEKSKGRRELEDKTSTETEKVEGPKEHSFPVAPTIETSPEVKQTFAMMAAAIGKSDEKTKVKAGKAKVKINKVENKVETDQVKTDQAKTDQAKTDQAKIGKEGENTQTSHSRAHKNKQRVVASDSDRANDEVDHSTKMEYAIQEVQSTQEKQGTQEMHSAQDLWDRKTNRDNTSTSISDVISHTTPDFSQEGQLSFDNEGESAQYASIDKPSRTPRIRKSRLSRVVDKSKKAPANKKISHKIQKGRVRKSAPKVSQKNTPVSQRDITSSKVTRKYSKSVAKK